MSEHDLNWRFVEDLIIEPEHIAQARQLSQELGIEAISPATGAAVSTLTAAINPNTIVEIGTGVGVSGLWLLLNAPNATLTSIDIEAEYHQFAKTIFAAGNVPHNRLRLITDTASQVLNRMNENSYDLVLVDAEPAQTRLYVEHALRLLRPGGSVIVVHSLLKGRVADPANRNDEVIALRKLITELNKSAETALTISPLGDGILHIVHTVQTPNKSQPSPRVNTP